MKIGIYDPYLDDLGGGEKYMMTMAECLSKKHNVSVFWDKKSDVEMLLKRFSLNFDAIMLKKNIFAAHIGIGERLLETRKYDVIIFLSDGSFPMSFSKKLFVHIQQPLPRVSLSSWKGKIKTSRINTLIYNSEFTKSFNEKILPGIPSKVIYPPVSFLAKEVKKENIILHVGRFRVTNSGTSDYKKQHVMIEAFKQMVDQKQIKNWKFMLAVSVKTEDEEKFALMRKTASGYPIEFLLNKSNDELWNTYNKAKIYWHASGYGEDITAHPEYAEHFGISTVEAMAAGAVPVVINSGGQKEIVTHENGFLWDTLSQLQDYTRHLADDHALWNRLSRQAGASAQKFSNETFCEDINNLIERT